MSERPVFDDAHWHWNGNYPAELFSDDETADPPPVAHIAFFLAWAIERGLASAEHTDRTVPEVCRLLDGTITPWGYLTERIGCRLVDDDFNEVGLAFARAYYGKGSNSPHLYFGDFCRVFEEAETAYHVADTLANYERLKPLLDHALETWRQDNSLTDWEDEALDWWAEHTPEEDEQEDATD